MARHPYPEREPEPRSFPATGADLPGEAPQREDAEICRDVESALFYDEAVKSVNIRIQCEQGVVTLNGTVDSDQEKRRAEEDARSVPSVKAVNNNLRLAA